MKGNPAITARSVPAQPVGCLLGEGVHPLLARVFAARGVSTRRDVSGEFAQLAPPDSMLNLRVMARLLAEGIALGKRHVIVADYDADGATACAVGMRALKAFGAVVDYLVPNRFEYGYGLTPEIVRLAQSRFRPDVLITVDNGISSFEGVAEANALGIATLITDHHLPAATLPAAACIVNPNQPGCGFPSKQLAGVGVMFYLMLALRAELRERGTFEPAAGRIAQSPPSSPTLLPEGEGRFEPAAGRIAQSPPSSPTLLPEGEGRFEPAAGRIAQSPPSSPTLLPEGEGRFEPAAGRIARKEPNLAELLPLVALGTVADVVGLDANNRILVHQGLQRIRAGRMPAGMAALFAAAGRDHRRAAAHDLGFVAGPRLNAAGRLTDMSLGIECLLTDDAGRAQAIATELDRLNRQRRAIESDMQSGALAALESMAPGDAYSLSLFDPDWHQGVIGIVAGRIKDRFHLPTVAFARGAAGEIRGSGRSIPGLHLRDALDRVATQAPGLILKFGGHAAAAGLTLREQDFARFRDVFEMTARALLTPADLQRVIETDGSLEEPYLALGTALLLEAEVWGQGFPLPRFCDEFEVRSQRVVAERHLKLVLKRGAVLVDAIRFQQVEPMPARILAVYVPAANAYGGTLALQLNIEHWQAA